MSFSIEILDIAKLDLKESLLFYKAIKVIGVIHTSRKSKIIDKRTN